MPPVEKPARTATPKPKAKLRKPAVAVGDFGANRLGGGGPLSGMG